MLLLDRSLQVTVYCFTLRRHAFFLTAKRSSFGFSNHCRVLSKHEQGNMTKPANRWEKREHAFETSTYRMHWVELYYTKIVGYLPRNYLDILVNMGRRRGQEYDEDFTFVSPVVKYLLFIFNLIFWVSVVLMNKVFDGKAVYCSLF